MKKKLKYILLTLFSFSAIVTYIFVNYNIPLHSKIILELMKVNRDLPTVSSNFYQNPIEDITYKDIVYKERNGEELKLDIYSATKELEGGSPVLIYVFGNAWIYGEKTIPTALSPIIDALRDEGITVISTSYELAKDTLIFDKQISDIKDTVRWINKNKDIYNFDTNSIGVIGPSAGAQLSMVAAYSDNDKFVDDKDLAKYPSTVKYVIDLFGPSELKKLNFSYAPKAVLDQLLTLDLDKLDAEFSPINYVKENLPNTLVIHSEKDTLVPYSTSLDLYNKALSYDNNFEFFTLKDCTHYLENLSEKEAATLYLKIINYIISNSNL